MSKDHRDWMDESGNLQDAEFRALLRDFRSAVIHAARHEPGQQNSPEFTALLKNFRSAVTHVALRESARTRAAGNWSLDVARRRERRRLVLSWSAGAAVLCAAVLCVVLFPTALRGRQTASNAAAVTTAVPEGQQTPAAAQQAGIVPGPQATPAAEADAALLEAVDTDVSTSVPPSLAPLVVMEDWASALTGAPNTSAENGAALNTTENVNADH